jgi:hypothetical protein
MERVCELGNLPENWDSYEARPVDPRCAMAAIQLIMSVFGPAVPTPAVVPTSRGGVQFEWHREGVDLEIEIESPGRFHVVFEDVREDVETEETLTTDLQPLVRLLERISKSD